MARATDIAQRDRAFRQTGIAIARANRARQRRADRSVAVDNRIFQLNRLAVLKRWRGIVKDLQVQLAGGHTAIPGLDVADRITRLIQPLQQR